jgi:hypothetical protein
MIAVRVPGRVEGARRFELREMVGLGSYPHLTVAAGCDIDDDSWPLAPCRDATVAALPRRAPKEPGAWPARFRSRRRPDVAPSIVS